MAREPIQNNSDQIRFLLKEFFTEQAYSPNDIAEAIENKELFTNPIEILPYLQSALLDDQILEVEIDNLTRVYFSRLYDDLPDLEPIDDNGKIIYVEPDYNPADYLKELDYINSWPLEPGMGNLAVRHSQKVIFRLFTSSYAVELGTYFLEQAEVQKIPCLRFEYPVIGRIVRGARAYRAKVPNDFSLIAKIIDEKTKNIIRGEVVDISAQGMAFKVGKHERHLVPESENRVLELEYNNDTVVQVTVNIKHLSKVRSKEGTNHLCGVNFDLETRTIASEIESIVAQVQRAHLKTLSDLSEESGITLIS
ncbi:PilZ domain-containing protein [Desulforhopalus sp. 52FAK]